MGVEKNGGTDMEINENEDEGVHNGASHTTSGIFQWRAKGNTGSMADYGKGLFFFNFNQFDIYSLVSGRP
jgi:hypothetical protein